MNDLRTAAQQALEALENLYLTLSPESALAISLNRRITALRAALAEPDLDRCPRCGGPADNGHDREVPPNPYYCTKCMAEPVQEPVAWRTFDGEGGWDYRDYENNEDYIYQYVKRNGGRYAHWVEPLYTAPKHDNYWQEEARRYAGNCDFWRERYTELIMAVGSKYPGEDRHQTALRYITNAERNTTTRNEVQKS